MDLLILAIGLVLGGACVFAVSRVRALEQTVRAADLRASDADAICRDVLGEFRKDRERTDQHDLEIAKLYQDHGMRRD